MKASNANPDSEEEDLQMIEIADENEIFIQIGLYINVGISLEGYSYCKVKALVYTMPTSGVHDPTVTFFLNVLTYFHI